MSNDPEPAAGARGSVAAAPKQRDLIQSMQPGSSAFWAYLLEASAEPAGAAGTAGVLPGYDARAVSHLHRLQTALYRHVVGDLNERMLYRAAYPEYRAALAPQVAQAKLLNQALPQYCWDGAGVMLAADRNHALGLFKIGGESDFYTAVCYAYLLGNPPFLERAKSRGYAASANFCFGVIPPSPMLGRS